MKQVVLATTITGTYDPRLVALSAGIAIMVSYAALGVAGRVTAARGRTRLVWLAGGALCLGLGIWSMHCIGVLAFHPAVPAGESVPRSYDVPAVLVSLLAAVLVAGLALYIVSRRSMSRSAWLAGGGGVGLGLAVMRYSGMAGLRAVAPMRYDPLRFSLSLAITVGASLAVLWLAFRLRRQTRRWNWWKGGSAVLMGCAIAGLHYTGMAAAIFTMTPGRRPHGSDAVQTLLLCAAGIGVVTLFILGAALLMAHLDRLRTIQAAAAVLHSEARYRALTEQSSDLVAICDAEGVIRYASPSHQWVLGRAPEQLLGACVFDAIHRDDRARAREALRACAEQSAAPGAITLRLRHADGSWLSVEALTNNRLHDPVVRGVIITSRDVTERASILEALSRANRALTAISAGHHAIVRAATEADLLRDICRTIVEVGGYRLAWVGFAEHDAAKTVSPVASMGDGAAYVDTIAVSWDETLQGHGPAGTAIRTGRPCVVHNVTTDAMFDLWRAAALEYGFGSAISLPLLSAGQAIGALNIYAAERAAFDAEEERLLTDLADDLAYGITALRTDVERRRAEEALRYQALHDALTGLPNRALLRDRVEQALSTARRNHTPLALLLLDLDHFKDVNDTLGHPHGDALLQEVAERLRGALREADTVARLGGDEFAVLLPEAGPDGAAGTAARIRAALEAPVIVEGVTLQVGASIGAALYPEHGHDGQTLLRGADVAMYVAKRGGDAYAVYDTAHDTYTPDRLALLAELRQAIARGELALHYQPKIDLTSGRVSAVEALVRWPHARQGLIGPAQFIPLAEQSGLIRPLALWALDEALRQARDWRRAGLSLSVAVNLSTLNLHDPELPDQIAGLLRAYDVPASSLRIEVTESTLMAHTARAGEALGRLAELGVGISVDDYGTGYSSLAYLKRLPVDELKIDMSFVRAMTRDSSDAAIVSSTVALGHSLGLRVVAEGVEDSTTYDMLAAMGCDTAQGYYLSRPLPPEHLAAWLRAAERGVA